jgi:dTDP-4-amino-4,6-dideoxygalactose transaminase
MTIATGQRLAIHGGPKAVQSDPGDIFAWPIITEEDEQAVLAVLRAGKMSGTEVTIEFEKEFAEWHGVRHALAHNTGTAALHAAMFACGVGIGDEVIVPSLTYWASALPALSLGATIVFAEVEPSTLCLDPADLEHRIASRTKAIVPVHYCGHPCDMDPIMEIAGRHGVKVIEDVSHAHGGRYKGRLLGTIGHTGAMSLMSGKSLAIGEGGMLITDDQAIYERAAAFGHYERTGSLTLPELQRFAGLPLGGHKYRMHQLSSAVGRVQLRHYPQRMEEIQRSMNYFWDLLDGVPGIRAHRPLAGSGSTMGGWYAAHGLYVPEELGGLSVHRFCEAVRAEGAWTRPGANLLLHLHPMLNEADIYGHGRPTRLAHAERDVRQPAGSLPVSESMPERVYSIPWFKKYRPRILEEHAAAFRKVAEAADALL